MSSARKQAGKLRRLQARRERPAVEPKKQEIKAAIADEIKHAPNRPHSPQHALYLQEKQLIERCIAVLKSKLTQKRILRQSAYWGALLTIFAGFCCLIHEIFPENSLKKWASIAMLLPAFSRFPLSSKQPYAEIWVEMSDTYSSMSRENATTMKNLCRKYKVDDEKNVMYVIMQLQGLLEILAIRDRKSENTYQTTQIYRTTFFQSANAQMMASTIAPIIFKQLGITLQNNQLAEFQAEEKKHQSHR